MAKKTYQGSCHCGRVKFEAAFDLAEGTGKCNCTSCWKKRLWSARAKPGDFKAIAGEQETSRYDADTKKGGGFCKHCGVLTYGWVPKAEWNPEEYVSIAVSSLDDLDPAELAAAPVQYMDGRHDNWWEKPAETRHL
jgi:hypothetical protein